MDVFGNVSNLFPYIQSISSLLTKARIKAKSSGIGKSGRKVSRYECFFKEIIYKNKSKGADTIIFKMFQNSNRQHFQQVVRRTLVVHGPLKTESLSILSLGFCWTPIILLSCLHFLATTTFNYYTGTTPVPKVRSNGSLPFYFSWHCVQRR